MTIAVVPRNITIEQREGPTWTQVSQLDLPGDMEFRIEPEVSAGPAGYSILDESLIRNPINLCGDKVYFLPNGSAIAVDGQICSGVIYLARANELETSRAVTIFGSTGKMKRWRYVTGSWESQ